MFKKIYIYIYIYMHMRILVCVCILVKLFQELSDDLHAECSDLLGRETRIVAIEIAHGDQVGGWVCVRVLCVHECVCVRVFIHT